MSIWGTLEHIGNDGDGPTQRGTVLSYADGFSNHYPDLTGEYERPAYVQVAIVPPYCVPSHEDWTEDDDTLGSWLRLDVQAPEPLNMRLGEFAVEARAATVVLDEEAARSLRDELTWWLDQPKVRP